MVKRLTALIVVSLSLLSVGEGNGDYVYDPTYGRTRSNCDLYDMPSSKDRVCRTQRAGEVLWYTGTLNAERCNDGNVRKATWRDDLSFCPGYVSMRMSLWCDFVNVTSLIYKDGRPLTGVATVTFNSLQAEDQGLYQCRRNDTEEVIGEFNMTVQSDVHVGGANVYECVPFNSDLFRDQECCYYNNWQPGLGFYRHNRFHFAVYGDDPKIESISLEWYTDQKYHYPTDLGVFVERNATNPNIRAVNFYHDPLSVTTETNSELLMSVRIIVSNNFSSFSLCILARFQRTNKISANISLPQNADTTAGGVATFICQFGSNKQGDAPLLRFELASPEEEISENNTFLRTECYYWKECAEWMFSSNLSTSISIRPIQNVNTSSFVLYSYEVRLTNVEESLNGSVFSCSISTYSPTDEHSGSQEFIEWKGSADLIVGLAKDPKIKIKMINSTENEDSGSVNNKRLVASIAVPVNLLMLAVLIAVLLALIRIRKSKRRLTLREPAQIPLTDQSYLSTSQSTINSEVGTPVTEQKQLPSISIVEVGGARRHESIVGETRSMDSGVSCTEHYENSRQRPSSLQMTETQHQDLLGHVSPIRLCRSEADIIDSDKVLTVPPTNLRIPRQKVVVYISYTNRTSRWVRSTLKPLIDSWNIAEVMIHDRDMVAGKAISNERRRLIVQADKIILVISPDYYNSDWCSYELMHAIQSEPTLSRGRIIPILIDGCQVLPKNMEVVVPLFAHEQDFSIRLMAAIYPHHRLSQ